MAKSKANDISTTESVGSLSVCLEKLKAGDESATRRVFELFFPRLHALARKTLAGQLQRIIDPDDAVQSAFRSLWEKAEFDHIKDRNDLWRLLASKTVEKAKKHLRRERAKKRGSGAVLGQSDLEDSNTSGVSLEEVAKLPAEAFDVCCEEMFELLDRELRPIAFLKMMRYQIVEIAKLLGCSKSKVDAELRIIRETWSRELRAET